MSNAESGRNAYDAQHADGDAKSRERAAGDRPHMHNVATVVGSESSGARRAMIAHAHNHTLTKQSLRAQT